MGWTDVVAAAHSSEIGVLSSKGDASVTANLALATNALENQRHKEALAASLNVITANPGIERQGEALFLKGCALYGLGAAEREDVHVRRRLAQRDTRVGERDRRRRRRRRRARARRAVHL